MSYYESSYFPQAKFASQISYLKMIFSLKKDNKKINVHNLKYPELAYLHAYSVSVYFRIRFQSVSQM